MNLLRKLNLSRRLALLIALFALGFLAYGGWSFKTLSALKVNGPLYQRIVQGKDLVADVLPPPSYIIESYLVVLQIAATEREAEQRTLIGRLAELKGEYEARHAFWLKAELERDIRTTLLEQAHAPALEFYARAFDDFIPAIQRRDAAGAAAAMNRLSHSYAAHRAAIDRVVRLSTARNGEEEAQAVAQIQSATLLLLLILAGALGAAVAGAVVIVRSITHPLADAVCIARSVAAGNLDNSIDLRFQDEPGQVLRALHDMTASLSRIVHQVRGGAETIAMASGEIAAGNHDLSARSEVQASNLEETASTMEELTSAVRQNAGNAQHANELAAGAAGQAVGGKRVMGQVVATMGSIRDSSAQIADIIGVIDGLAFQTNILALNAAVEAARAGDHGRGFAVVAGEVRSLAQRSAASARAIRTLIERSVGEIDTGGKLVDEAGATMDRIVASVEKVARIMNDISSACREQSVGIEQINKAIAQIDEMTQQNAALVEQATAATQSLRQEADALVHSANAFRLGDLPAPQAVQALSSRGRVGRRLLAVPA
ncbi:MAG TPA: methyl-accepting chemotaxis protein [Paucimonas sp.]|nr:methyl-accepting chemotaxis protein [Paucimonas sp.]